MRIAIIVVIIVMTAIESYCQHSSNTTDKILTLPDKFFATLQKKSGNLDKKLLRATDKYLSKLEKSELAMYKKISQQDSLKAKEIFGGVDAITKRYADMKSDSTLFTERLAPYNAFNDTLHTALNFINAKKGATLNKNQFNLAKAAFLKHSFANKRINASASIQKKISEHHEFLKGKLNNSTLGSSYNKYKKEVYYYKEQVKEYTQLFNNPDKLTQKVISGLSKIEAFNQFMQKYSLIAQLFAAPENMGATESLAGLQTRAQIQQLVNSRMNVNGGGGQNILQQNIQTAKNQFQKLKDKAANFGNGDINTPDFKPNNQKTKRLFDRLELGMNMQSTKSDGYFPATTDLTVTSGYKLNDKAVAGIGAAYRFGLGRSIRHIAFTSEGVGVKTFFDVQVKNTFWLTCGAEANYRNNFKSVEELKDHSAWAQSAMAGVVKKYKAGKKLKGELRLLYDFRWRHQVPTGQPIVFRHGFNLK